MKIDMDEDIVPRMVLLIVVLVKDNVFDFLFLSVLQFIQEMFGIVDGYYDFTALLYGVEIEAIETI
jgi:hypothetical protein